MDVLDGIRLVAAVIGIAVTGRFRWNVRRDRRVGTRGACTVVGETHAGRMLGIANSTLGLIYFVLLFVLALTGIVSAANAESADILLSALTILGAMGSFYLLYQLVVVLRLRCPLCVTAHLLNFTLLAAQSLLAR